MDPVKLIKLIFTGVFTLAGSLLLFIGIKEGNASYYLIKYGIETEGVVIEMYKKPVRGLEKSSGSFAPVVRFMTEEGSIITYYSTTFTSFNDFAVGQKVKIWYRAGNPQLATLEGKDNWILAVAFGIFGGAICLIFYPMFFRQLIPWLKTRHQH